MSKFALFTYDPHDAGGGVNDLLHIGSMDECVALAEKEGAADYIDAHIADANTLQIVRRGSTKSFWLSDETGLSKDRGTVTRRFVWDAEAQVA